jgi:hypothetical protein
MRSQAILAAAAAAALFQCTAFALVPTRVIQARGYGIESICINEDTPCSSLETIHASCTDVAKGDVVKEQQCICGGYFFQNFGG